MKIVIEPIKRISWADRKIVPWNDVYECYDWMLKGTGTNFEDLKRKEYLFIEHEVPVNIVIYY